MIWSSDSQTKIKNIFQFHLLFMMKTIKNQLKLVVNSLNENISVFCWFFIFGLWCWWNFFFIMFLVNLLFRFYAGHLEHWKGSVDYKGSDTMHFFSRWSWNTERQYGHGKSLHYQQQQLQQKMEIWNHKIFESMPLAISVAYPIQISKKRLFSLIFLSILYLKIQANVQAFNLIQVILAWLWKKVI